TGITVRAKFYAPRGRSLESVGGVHALRAIDDKGRNLVVTNDSAAPGDPGWLGNGANRRGWSYVELNLPLPQPDAQSIEQLEGEAVAITIGTWKSFTVTNIAARGTDAIDLSALLPGAALVISKVSPGPHQQLIQARLQGPAEIRQLDLNAGFDDATSGSWINENGFKNLCSNAAPNTTIHTLSPRGARRLA